MFFSWIAIVGCLALSGSTLARPLEDAGSANYSSCERFTFPREDARTAAHKRAVLDRRDYVGAYEFNNVRGFMDAMMEKAKRSEAYASPRDYKWQILKEYDVEQTGFAMAGEFMDGNLAVVVVSDRAVMQHWLPAPRQGGLNQVMNDLENYEPADDWIGQKIKQRPDLFGAHTSASVIVMAPEPPSNQGYWSRMEQRRRLRESFVDLGIDESRFDLYHYAPSPTAYRLYGFETVAAICNAYCYNTFNPSRMAVQYDHGEGALPARLGVYFQDSIVLETHLRRSNGEHDIPPLPRYEDQGPPPPEYPELPPPYNEVCWRQPSGSSENGPSEHHPSEHHPSENHSSEHRSSEHRPSDD